MCLLCSWRMNATQSYMLFLHILQYIMWEAYIECCRCCMGFVTVATELVEKQDKHPRWNYFVCQMDSCDYKTHLLLELETMCDSAQLDFIHGRCFWTSTIYHFSTLSHMWLACLLRPWIPRMQPWIKDFSILIVFSYAAILKLLVI